MGGEGFWILARLPRRRRFEHPDGHERSAQGIHGLADLPGLGSQTELKRSQKPKRPPEIKCQHVATYLMEML
jgi:hypothetical protein